MDGRMDIISAAALVKILI